MIVFMVFDRAFSGLLVFIFGNLAVNWAGKEIKQNAHPVNNSNIIAKFLFINFYFFLYGPFYPQHFSHSGAKQFYAPAI